MAVGLPAKRRKLSEGTAAAAAAATAGVAAALGRKVRVYRSSMVASARAVVASRTAGTGSAVIRVVFPDHYVLEAKFGRSEAVQGLVDLLRRAVSPWAAPFYIYTAPPKEKVEDLAADFSSAGAGGGDRWPFYLREEVCSMEGLDVDAEGL
ncbi:unnamed protein product [Spirodela intermedia]|uniref:Uncharacterized protein n=1 Tax=Spirodela intermedia TaxID=51605 RepID=A0A7I8J4W7_SPIIN|nr:unnamed protein product [Spirodela intermedia]CAA6665276.1 unnamed protein product [Spirodela intermedia]